MMVQVRYRTVALFALAISLLLLAAVPQMAGAESRRAQAPGQERKAAPAPEATAPDAAASSTDASAQNTAADNPEDFSNHDATNGPGGQVCDGDPDNEPGAGGNYENTCPAGPSQNGVGDGEANGKPCAGCVGNADDKNPPGQADSGPNDANNGYECDQKGRSDREGNNGVGFGNPAHTGCESTPPPATCPDGSAMPASGNPADCTPKCPDGSAMPASGKVEDCVTATGTPTVVLGELLARPVEVLGVQLSAPEAAAVAPAALARTGGFQLVTLLQVALVLAGLGLGLTAAARLRRRDVVDIASRLG